MFSTASIASYVLLSIPVSLGLAIERSVSLSSAAHSVPHAEREPVDQELQPSPNITWASDLTPRSRNDLMFWGMGTKHADCTGGPGAVSSDCTGSPFIVSTYSYWDRCSTGNDTAGTTLIQCWQDFWAYDNHFMLIDCAQVPGGWGSLAGGTHVGTLVKVRAINDYHKFYDTLGDCWATGVVKGADSHCAFSDGRLVATCPLP